MANSNKKLGALLKNEWHRNFRINSIVIALFIALGVAYVANYEEEVVVVAGKVTALQVQSSDAMKEIYAVINVEHGGLIKIKVPHGLRIKKGDAVSLDKRITVYFGIPDYSFQSE